ncbi:hypothetical protein KY331_03445 [Candidatus Woesearchaeota archaeon]|nr:hypothetical protein [Candidatus Woesearchaeota archaeon]
METTVLNDVIVNDISSPVKKPKKPEVIGMTDEDFLAMDQESLTYREEKDSSLQSILMYIGGRAADSLSTALALASGRFYETNDMANGLYERFGVGLGSVVDELILVSYMMILYQMTDPKHSNLGNKLLKMIGIGSLGCGFSNLLKYYLN